MSAHRPQRLLRGPHFLILCAFAMLSAGVSSAFGADAGDTSKMGRDYRSAAQPLLKKWCYRCHAGERVEAEVDLGSVADWKRAQGASRLWQRVRRMLTSRQMPPKEAPQPSDRERKQLETWVRSFLLRAAQARAGDPGPVVLRRLSNSEYTYSLRDLTDVMTLDPAAQFPVDGAAGEGFTNTGVGLVMSPSLVRKYLDAAKQVAQHAVLTPDGLRFSRYTSRRDHTDEALAQIQAFYRRYAADGSGSNVNLQGIRFTTNQGGHLPLRRYLEALQEHRVALEQGHIRLSDVAQRKQLSPKYLASLWQALASDAPRPTSFLMDRLRRRWRGDGPQTAAALASVVESWQKSLWKFNTIGHIGRTGGPKSWQEAVSPLRSVQSFKHKLPGGATGKPVTVTLSVRPVDADARPLVVWKDARLVGGATVIPLAKMAGVESYLERRRRDVLSHTARYLAACQEADGQTDVSKLAQKRQLDPALLRSWLELLEIGTPAPVRVQGRLTQQMRKSGNYAFIQGWGTTATPLIVANSSDQQVRIPGIAKPHSIVAHPSPTLFVAAGWQSPVRARVKITARIADAHPECGNGVEWFLQYRTGKGRTTLAKGDFGRKGAQQPKPVEIPVRPGSLVSLILGPRHRAHACDLTAIDLKIEEMDGKRRVWDLATDVAPNILQSNPHADRYGNLETWHFYKGPMTSVMKPETIARPIPAGSLLAQWRAEKDADRRRQLADRIQQLASGRNTVPAQSPDGRLLAVLKRMASPQRFAPALAGIPTDPRFGKHPSGTNVGPNDLVLTAPATLKLEIPAALANGRELVVAGRLDPAASAAVQFDVVVNGSTPSDLRADRPLIVSERGPAHEETERALADFRRLFPIALCYARIVPVDEVVTLTLFYREDGPLQKLMLSRAETAELNRLWTELFFISREPLKRITAFEQISEFATQDRPDLVKAFKALAQPIQQRAAAFRAEQRAAERPQWQALLHWAARAWRRPLTTHEQTALRAFYRGLRQNDIAHERALRLTLARVITSPRFLYRREQPPPGVRPQRVTDNEMASRLSFFLWSSLPDAGLREAALKGQLQASDEVLRREMRRMLADARVRRLAVEFACQWLHVREFDRNDEKNEKLYPQFQKLRAAMYEETVRFFTDLFRNDRSVLAMFDADYVLVNEPLAAHYGIPWASTSTSELAPPRVALTAASQTPWRRIPGARQYGRGGILAMSTILSKQSGASRTSPILRGNWVYETLLGQRLPRPPANVPQLPERVPSGLTARQLIQRHSSDPACAKCHARIDPYGFALEKYDAIGRLRQRSVNTRTRLPDGDAIEGLPGLRDYLSKKRRAAVLQQFCRKLLGYALGRSVQLSDEPLLARMLERLKQSDYRFSAAVETIVLSRQFREIRGRDYSAE